MAKHTTLKREWTLQPIKDGQHYGGLYEAFSEEDARETAKNFLSYVITRYDRVVIYHYGAELVTVTRDSLAAEGEEPAGTKTPVS
jgi:hypothetical protein